MHSSQHQIDVERDDVGKQVAEMLVALLPQLEKIDVANFPPIKQLTGGISNSIYLQETPIGTKYIIRVFGKGSEKIVNRQAELEICIHLAANSIGPEIIATFGNGRVEEFFEGRTLTAVDLRQPEIFVVTARKIGQMHKIPTPPGWELGIWEQLDRWYSEAGSAELTGEKKAKIDSIDLVTLRQEMDELRRVLSVLPVPIVTAHNDLLCGNILLEADNKTMHFLDFEYGMMNYSAFDLANHWNEWPGFDNQLANDYSSFPSIQQQREFVTQYLTSLNGHVPSSEDVDVLRRHVLQFSLLSNLFWGLWAVLETSVSLIDFDYASYAASRIRRFRDTKEWLTNPQ